VLFLQDVQEGDRNDVHRLSGAGSRGEGEESAAQPPQARERGGLRGGLPIAVPIQPRLPPDRGRVAVHLSRSAARRGSEIPEKSHPTRIRARAPSSLMCVKAPAAGVWYQLTRNTPPPL